MYLRCLLQILKKFCLIFLSWEGSIDLGPKIDKDMCNITDENHLEAREVIVRALEDKIMNSETQGDAQGEEEEEPHYGN